MEGITPTLAFAALFFGLSGHPQDKMQPIQQAAHQEQLQAVNYRVWSKVPCGDIARTSDGVGPWIGFLGHESALASASLGDPTDDVVGDSSFDAEGRMLFDEPIVAYEDKVSEDGCGTPVP